MGRRQQRVQAKNLSYELREASFENQNLHLKAWFSLLVPRHQDYRAASDSPTAGSGQMPKKENPAQGGVFFKAFNGRMTG